MGVRRWAAGIETWLAGEDAFNYRPPAGSPVREGIEATGYGAGATGFAGATEEDRYWGRLSASGGAGGVEEDYYWRRLSDNWTGKDVLPSTYLDIHNACYEAYNANPLANYIVEMTTNFVLGNSSSSG